MKAIIYMFSGTGNTERICKLFASAFAESGCETEIFAITAHADAKIPSPARYDRIIVAYPVHGFNAPEPVLDFADKLPQTPGRFVYIVKTSGEPLRFNDGSSARLARKLAKKGYSVAGEFHYVMPYNMIFRHSEGMVAKLWRASKNRVPSEAESILAGELLPFRIRKANRALSAAFMIEHPAMKVIGKRFKIDADKCLDCGKCVRNCPAGNLTVTDVGIRFGENCIGCMRCSFNCPTDAIRIGLLNGWKVNGHYDFEGAADDGRLCRYCRRSYAEYLKKYDAPLRDAQGENK